MEGKGLLNNTVYHSTMSSIAGASMRLKVFVIKFSTTSKMIRLHYGVYCDCFAGLPGFKENDYFLGRWVCAHFFVLDGVL